MTWVLTNYANDKFILRTVNADDQRIVHDVDVGKKFAVVVKGATQDTLGMLAKVERS